MQVGMIGLGRMGASMVRRLLSGGHECVAYDVSPEAVKALEGEGAATVSSLEAFVAALRPPRIVWMMVPVAVVDETLARVGALLERGDTVVDGGNTLYHHDIRRARTLEPAGVNYLDVGVSGGVFGLERGYCLMIGGETDAVSRLHPIFTTLAPGEEAAPPTPGREGRDGSAEQGWLHCGPAGAGHFVKMVHNGIEYGVMAAYAEGFNLLRHAGVGRAERERDAETSPLEHPEHFRYDLDVGEVAELWRRGSVIGSWLLDLTARAFVDDPDLGAFSGRVSDSGEGRWTVQAAVEAGVPVPVLTAALYERFASRGEDHFANQVLSAMRFQFGGHHEKPAG
jgi:6-phosphogluconate dehydrogenase